MRNRVQLLFVGALIALVLPLSACSAPRQEPRVISPGDIVGVWALDESLDSPEQPYVSFVQDNTWSASDGCNRVQGQWQLGRDGALSVTSGPHTMMECEGAQLPMAVIMASQVELNDDILRIHGSYGSTVTELVRSTDPLVGPQGFPIGYWVESRTPTAPFLSISADRTFSGSDGCNNLVGTWETADDGATRFLSPATTLMACEGVDGWLSKASLGRVVAGVMTLQAEDGTVLGQLTALWPGRKP